MSANQADQLPPKQAAEIIGKSVWWLAQARKRKRRGPPFYRVGGRIVYQRSDLEAWYAGCRRE